MALGLVSSTVWDTVSCSVLTATPSVLASLLAMPSVLLTSPAWSKETRLPGY